MSEQRRRRRSEAVHENNVNLAEFVEEPVVNKEVEKQTIDIYKESLNEKYDHERDEPVRKPKKPVKKKKKNWIIPVVILIILLFLIVVCTAMVYFGYMQPMKKAERMVKSGRYSEATAIIATLPETSAVIQLEEEIYLAQIEQTYAQIESLIGREKYSDAEILMAQLPASEKKSEYEERITQAEADAYRKQQEQKYGQIESLIERKKLSEAEILLSELPDSERKNKIEIRITIAEIEELLENGNYDQAEKRMALIPQEYIDQDMKKSIAVQRANSMIIDGKYSEADELLAGFSGDTQVDKIREQIAYESRIFACIRDIKKYLKNPDSLSIYEIEFYAETKKDEAASTEDNPVYVEAEPSCVMHYGAQNGFGGNTTSYALFKGDEEGYMLIGSVDSLDEDDLDTDDDDYFFDMIVQIEINLLKEQTTIGDFDMERVQTLLRNNSYSTVKIIK